MFFIWLSLYTCLGFSFSVNDIWAVTWDIQQCGMCIEQSLRSACAYAQLWLSLEYFMTVDLLTEHYLEFLSLKGGCTDSSESTLVKMPHCWKSYVMAHLLSMVFAIKWDKDLDFVVCAVWQVVLGSFPLENGHFVCLTPITVLLQCFSFNLESDFLLVWQYTCGFYIIFTVNSFISSTLYTLNHSSKFFFSD